MDRDDIRARSTRNTVARSEKTRQAENPHLSETLRGTRTEAARVAGRRAELKPSHQRSHLSLAQSTRAHKNPTNPIPRCRSGKWKGTPYTFNHSASIEARPFAIGSFAANAYILPVEEDRERRHEGTKAQTRWKRDLHERERRSVSSH